MKILITGATGLIGKKIVKKLLQKKHTLCFLTTQTNKLKSLPNCTGFLWNPKKNRIDAKCINKVDAIIHLAGANIGKRWTTSYKKEIINSRVEGAAILYNLLQTDTHQVQHFITASGIGIYAHSYSQTYTEESTNFGTGFLSEVVQKWEESATKFKNLNMKVSKLRTGVVLTQKGGALQKMKEPIALGFGANLGNGKQQMSWIHINDLVQLYTYVLQHKIEGVVNAVAPEVVTNTVFTKTLAKQIKRKIILPNVPKFILNLLLGEMHVLLCESQKISSKKIQKHGFIFQFPTLKKSLQQLL